MDMRSDFQNFSVGVYLEIEDRAPVHSSGCRSALLAPGRLELSVMR